MNPRANRENPLAGRAISHALRCINAVDEIEPSDESSDDDEVTRMVQFSGMIGIDDLSYGSE
jgi:hypothetical protein